MASQEEHTTVYGGEEDLDDDDSEEDLDQDLVPDHHPLDDDDVDDVDDEDDSMSSAAGEVTIAVAGLPNGDPNTITATAITAQSSDSKQRQQRIDDLMVATAVVEEKKPMPSDESRRLFQRLWTDEDEIELLQGFLDYTTQRGTNNSSSHHHDTTAFYDQIKNKLQLDFNKNQLVEKLRRLKKKYRNVLTKISSGKDCIFKTPHDQSTFEISCKIWGGGGGSTASAAAADEPGLDDEEPNPNTVTPCLNLNDNHHNSIADPNSNYSEKKVPKSRKRSRGGGVKIESSEAAKLHTTNQQKTNQPASASASAGGATIPNLVEDTVKSCLLPLFKELLNNAMNGSLNSGVRGLGLGGLNASLNPLPMPIPMSLSFGGSMTGDSMVDEKWRKQHILELEVYSKRLELVQDQIKAQLEELRSMGSDQ